MIYVIDGATGKIAQRVDTLDSYAEHYAREGYTVLVSSTSVDIKTTYVVDGTFTPIPERPSAYHEWDWGTHSWVQNPALAEAAARTKRSSLLAASDWTQLPDVPLETKAAWVSYRQALRDVPEQPGYPFEVLWPLVPTPSDLTPPNIIDGIPVN